MIGLSKRHSYICALFIMMVQWDGGWVIMKPLNVLRSVPILHKGRA